MRSVKIRSRRPVHFTSTAGLKLHRIQANAQGGRRHQYRSSKWLEQIDLCLDAPSPQCDTPSPSCPRPPPLAMGHSPFGMPKKSPASPQDAHRSMSQNSGLAASSVEKAIIVIRSPATTQDIRRADVCNWIDHLASCPCRWDFIQNVASIHTRCHQRPDRPC